MVSHLSLQGSTASAVLQSRPFGPGLQILKDLTPAVSADGPYTLLVTAGAAVSTHASGRELRIRFELRGVFTSPTSVLYTCS